MLIVMYYINFIITFDWRRRPGRPRHTWLRTLNADLHPLNHGLNSAWRVGDLPRTENDGGNSWKRLRSSLGLARDDDDDDDARLNV